MATHVITDLRRSECHVVVERGLIGSPAFLERLTEGGERHDRIAVLAQPGARAVAETVAAAARSTGATTMLAILPDGEDAKRLAVVEDVCLRLNASGMTRSDLIVGVGGGALTDVAGFVAATYLRGVAAVLVPTTLLAAVDAAIGGKSGVNVGGKNLAGAFRHPRGVLIDPAVLETLPVELLRQGSAEALKAGLIADPDLLELYERHGLEAPLDEVVERAVAVKVDVVTRDFTERDVRAWLNYGHTVGHAVEVAAGLSHGEAVAVGMVAAGAAAEIELGFAGAARQRAAITGLGLPTSVSGVSRVTALDLMALDKKRDGSGLRMTLLRAIADPVLVPVDPATVSAALEAVGIT